MIQPHGVLIISLDLELYWGIRDKKSLEESKARLLGGRAALPRILSLFGSYEIHATWAVVGMLFFETKEQLMEALPEKRPRYENRRLSPYDHLSVVGRDESEDPFHFAPSLLRAIQATPFQEIGTQTFSHYYCLEPGADADSFRQDLGAAMRFAQSWNIPLRSLVFPRHQIRTDFLSILPEFGIEAYRGNPPFWMYAASPEKQRTLLRRGLRLLDAYLPLASHQTSALPEKSQYAPVCVPADRFLRPYSKVFEPVEPVRLKRVLSGMDHAARNGLLYHLWWHPEDFGLRTEENFSFLQRILDHYSRLQETLGMDSLNMGEWTASWIRQPSKLP